MLSKQLYSLNDLAFLSQCKTQEVYGTVEMKANHISVPKNNSEHEQKRSHHKRRLFEENFFVP
jgi:hypothetical protein